jgi:hypothetical protein
MRLNNSNFFHTRLALQPHLLASFVATRQVSPPLCYKGIL